VATNKFASGCAHCSVLVFAGGGSLRSGKSGWEVWCPTCHDIDIQAKSEDFDQDDLVLPSTPPQGCLTSIRLSVLGVTLMCRRCGQETVCVVGLYPDRPSRTYVGIHTTSDGRTMDLARRLLQQSGLSSLAKSLQYRLTDNRGEQCLANCCQQCGVLQGNQLVGDETMSRVTADGVDGLDTVVVADCPVLDWQRIVYGSCSAICV